MQTVKTKKYYRIREDSPLDHFLKFFVGGGIGLLIGAVIAIGMNEIHPLF